MQNTHKKNIKAKEKKLNKTKNRKTKSFCLTDVTPYRALPHLSDFRSSQQPHPKNTPKSPQTHFGPVTEFVPGTSGPFPPWSGPGSTPFGQTSWME